MPSHSCSPSGPLAKEETVSTTALGQCNSREDAVVFRTPRVRWTAIASVCPDEDGRVRAQHQDLRVETLRGHSVVFFAPLVPLLPLVAAHPAEHERNALFVGEIDYVLAGDLRLPAQHVDAEILHVAQYLRFALWIVAIQQVGRVVRAAHSEIAAIDLKIEVAALANIGELLVLCREAV